MLPSSNLTYSYTFDYHFTNLCLNPDLTPKLQSHKVKGLTCIYIQCPTDTSDSICSKLNSQSFPHKLASIPMFSILRNSKNPYQKAWHTRTPWVLLIYLINLSLYFLPLLVFTGARVIFFLKCKYNVIMSLPCLKSLSDLLSFLEYFKTLWQDIQRPEITSLNLSLDIHTFVTQLPMHWELHAFLSIGHALSCLKILIVSLPRISSLTLNTCTYRHTHTFHGFNSFQVYLSPGFSGSSKASLSVVLNASIALCVLYIIIPYYITTVCLFSTKL